MAPLFIKSAMPPVNDFSNCDSIAKVATPAVIVVARGSNPPTPIRAPFLLMYEVTNIELQTILKSMLSEFAQTNPSAPIFSVLKKRYAAPPKPSENANIHPDCRLTSDLVATEDTKASVIPLIARSGM